MKELISPHDLHIVNRVLDDIRRAFPTTEGIDYKDKMLEIISNHVFDVLANLQALYEEEAKYSMDLMAEAYGEKDRDN